MPRPRMKGGECLLTCSVSLTRKFWKVCFTRKPQHILLPANVAKKKRLNQDHGTSDHHRPTFTMNSSAGVSSGTPSASRRSSNLHDIRFSVVNFGRGGGEGGLERQEKRRGNNHL